MKTKLLRRANSALLSDPERTILWGCETSKSLLTVTSLAKHGRRTLRRTNGGQRQKQRRRLPKLPSGAVSSLSRARARGATPRGPGGSPRSRMEIDKRTNGFDYPERNNAKSVNGEQPNRAEREGTRTPDRTVLRVGPASARAPSLLNCFWGIWHKHGEIQYFSFCLDSLVHLGVKKWPQLNGGTDGVGESQV